MSFDLGFLESAFNDIYKPDQSEAGKVLLEPEREAHFYYSSFYNPFCPKEINQMFFTGSQRSAVGRAKATKKLDEKEIANDIMQYEIKENAEKLRDEWHALISRDYQSDEIKTKRRAAKMRTGRAQTINIQVGTLQIFLESQKDDHEEVQTRRSGTLLGAKPPSKEDLMPKEEEEIAQKPRKMSNSRYQETVAVANNQEVVFNNNTPPQPKKLSFANPQPSQPEKPKRQSSGSLKADASQQPPAPVVPFGAPMPKHQRKARASQSAPLKCKEESTSDNPRDKEVCVNEETQVIRAPHPMKRRPPTRPRK